MDSGECELEHGITILAGKNESGKTSVMEALEDFSAGKVRKEARPIGFQDQEPEISVTFALSRENAQQIFDQEKIAAEATGNVEFSATMSGNQKTFRFMGDSVNFDGTSIGHINSEIKNFTDEIRENFAKLQVIHEENESLRAVPWDFVPGLDFDNSTPAEIEDHYNSYKNTVTPTTENMDAKKDKNSIQQLFKKIETSLTSLKNIHGSQQKIIRLLEQKIPNFILFKTFEGTLPDSIPFDGFENNEWVKYLNSISDLKTEIIKSDDSIAKRNLKDNINVRLNSDYEKFWSQDASNLSVDWDSEKLEFFVKDEGGPAGPIFIPPSFRSKGKQWHLSFYIKISARAMEKTGVPNIILIDEPGLFLHAEAQKDVLRKLEESTKSTQVIFSTHSSYLIEPDKIARIKLISKTEEKGTQINKVRVDVEKEALTPILTAIGLNVDAGISALDKVRNVIVEHIADVYYLNAFMKLSGKDGINFMYGGSAENMSVLANILAGWGAKVTYLTNINPGLPGNGSNIAGNWLAADDLLNDILGTRGSIEDIFTKQDFRNFVLKDSEREYVETNSEYLASYQARTEEVRIKLAKTFLETCSEHSSIGFRNLSRKTQKNIGSLIGHLEGSFSRYEKEIAAAKVDQEK